MKKIFILTLLASALFAKYDNCKFKNQKYDEICQNSIKKGVSYKYANEFLLSYMKTMKYDEISWKYLQPSKIKLHRANEKKANNNLVSYIPKMVEHLKKYKEVYDYSEKKYGVNREVIAAILLKETKLGKIVPKHDAFRVFNTIVNRVEPTTSRDKWLLNMGKTNMVSVIEHCYKKGVVPEKCNLASSYAGAVGIPQFMPDSFIYSEGYKTPLADLSKMEDAIVSASKFLHQKASWSVLIDWSKIPSMPEVESAWYDFEFGNENASFVYEKSSSGKKYDCYACGKKELAYLKEYAQKVMRYNNSSNYSIGVMRLAYDAHILLKGKK